jgi:hypothetical protein
VADTIAGVVQINQPVKIIINSMVADFLSRQGEMKQRESNQ